MHRKPIIPICALAFCLSFLFVGCEPLDDAVELIETLQSVETSSSEPESVPEPTPTPDDRAVIDALGVVVGGDCPWSPGRSVSGWLLEKYPGGDWSCTETTVDYWSVDPESGAEVHFGFVVSQDGSFELETCVIAGATYTLEDLCGGETAAG